MDSNSILSAKIQTFTRIELEFAHEPRHLSLDDFQVDGGIVITRFQIQERFVGLDTSPFDIEKQYRIFVRGAGERLLMPDGVLDLLISEKPLGCRMENGKTVFRLFAPRATGVHLVLYEYPHSDSGMEFPMSKDRDGVWEVLLENPRYGMYYAYRILGVPHPTEMFDPDVAIADPYSECVVTRNHYRHPAKSLILPPEDFDWEGDTWICPSLEDLVIYEMHVRDMTIHSSSDVSPEKRGTYLGMAEEGKTGGLEYLRSLGVNAVELLPVQEFANIEVDYQDPGATVFNDWNPYALNHWGYMTSYFFAPESYYATGGNLTADLYCGADGRQVNELKQMVKSLHRCGISVILDVVYNHVSQYDHNPFKWIDKKYYFRLDDDQDFIKTSGCGNDFKTERPMARRLIVDSILHWMRQFHVDGFRFDLATMIDEATLDAITEKARELNPGVILIAEPWGGGKYGQTEFSKRGWASWNDRFRDDVKGQNPKDGLGYLFGAWRQGVHSGSLRRYVRGTLIEDDGLYFKAGHSVNYFESHDDFTFGDFVRIGSGRVRADEAVTDVGANARLTETEMKILKLGALFLFTSQGAVMMHEGQEYARSKVIASSGVRDSLTGRIDSNSYNKDDETNWINYRHAEINRGLVDYYRGLISLRRRFSVFRRARSDAFHFLECANPFGFGYIITTGDPGCEDLFAVLMNSHGSMEAEFHLPESRWSILADGMKCYFDELPVIRTGEVRIPPISGAVLMKKAGRPTWS